MIRVFLLLIFLTVIIAAILDINVWIALIGFLVVIGGLPYATRGKGGSYLTPAAESKCPWCHERVKIGAAACHHCGRSLVREVAQPAVAAEAPSSEQAGRLETPAEPQQLRVIDGDRHATSRD